MNTNPVSSDSTTEVGQEARAAAFLKPTGQANPNLIGRSGALPATAADIPATRIYLPAIPADSQETRTDTAEIAPYIVEIGTYMKAIAGCSPETRIALMETTPDWS